MDSSSVGPSLSSSSLDVTKLNAELVADEKENMRLWLRAQMDSLVDPLIDKLFDKFNNNCCNKFTNFSTLGLNKSNVGNAQVMDQTVEYVEPELNHPHQSNKSLAFITYSSFMDINNRLEAINSTQLNAQKHEIINCTQSSTQNGHFESISNSQSSKQFTNSQPTFSNGLTNFDPQSIKQEITDDKPIRTYQINCPSTANLTDQNDLDEDEDDCECDDCANGGICGINAKQEEDENYMIEISDNDRDDNREQPMNKKPRMDTTQPNSHGNQQQQTQTDRFMVEPLQASSSRQKVPKDPSRQQHKSQLCNYPGCGRQFRDLTDLTRHKRTHLGIRPYRCRWPDCGFAATHRTNTLTHIRRKHLTIGDRDLQANEIAVYVEVVRELL